MLESSGGAEGMRRPILAAFLRPEWVYLALAVTLGCAYLVITPPFQVPDEGAHFYRSYATSEGRIVCLKRGNETGHDLPAALKRLADRYERLWKHHEEKTSLHEILDGHSLKIDTTNREFMAFSNAAVHPPLTYLPQAVGIMLARLSSGSALTCLYAGRFANLLATVALIFIAIRIAPIGKWTFVVLALMPMTLSLAASLSSDALTIALAFLFVAQILALVMTSEDSVTDRSVLALALVSAAIGLAKQAYFFLPFCYFMIPPTKFGGVSRYLTRGAVVIGACLLAVAGWSYVVRGIYSPADPNVGMNPAEQLRMMRQDPLEFLHTLARTAPWMPLYAEEFVGRLGLIDIRLPGWVYTLELALLLTVAISEFGVRPGLLARQVVVAAGVLCTVLLTVLTVMHLTWDKVGAKNISLQGRYFIPIAPLAALVTGWCIGRLLPSPFFRLRPAVSFVALLAAIVASQMALVRVHDRYFVDSAACAAQRCYMRGVAFAQKTGQETQAREAFEEASRAYPGHIGARFELANLAARQADYPEAIRLFRETLKLDPGNAEAKARLANAAQAQEMLGQLLQRIPASLHEMVRLNNLTEEPNKGTQDSRLYMKPIRGPIVDRSGRVELPMDFTGSAPTPSGEPVWVEGSASDSATQSKPAPFFAYSTTPLAGTMRIFVFPPPVNAVLLPDDEVSWYYQRRMESLSEQEVEQEMAYRRKLGLHVPADKSPH
jgi:uncharacterized membrane protein